MSQLLIKTIGNALNATSYISPKYASNKALKLFSTPRKGSYTSDQEAIITDATQETLSHNNLDIAVYNWKGNGKSVLLAHGWESNAARWDYILNDLKAQDYDIIALDAPAHGNSDGKLFTALLYAECMNEVAKTYKPEAIIGHSVGGMATIFFNHFNDAPYLKKIVTLGAPAHFTGVFSRYKNMMGYNKRIGNGLDSIVLKRYGKTVEYFSAANFTESFKPKGLIIHDKTDKIIPYEDALLFANRYKNAKLITTEGFGHGLKDKSIIPNIIEFINEDA